MSILSVSWGMSNLCAFPIAIGFQDHDGEFVIGIHIGPFFVDIAWGRA